MGDRSIAPRSVLPPDPITTTFDDRNDYAVALIESLVGSVPHIVIRSTICGTDPTDGSGSCQDTPQTCSQTDTAPRFREAAFSRLQYSPTRNLVGHHRQNQPEVPIHLEAHGNVGLNHGFCYPVPPSPERDCTRVSGAGCGSVASNEIRNKTTRKCLKYGFVISPPSPRAHFPPRLRVTP